jgi:type IV secretory pathway VirB3-like protein
MTRKTDDAMSNLSLSEKYAIGAALALLVVVIVDNPWLTLVISVLGLVAGLLVARQVSMRRAAIVALVAFAVSLVLGLFTLLR